MQLGVSAERIHVTGTGPVVASTAFPDSFLAKHFISGPFVLFLGQHYDYKGYRQVLESTKLVWEKFSDAHFVFIGPAVKDSENTFKLFEDPRVKRLGQVSLQDKTDALAACALLCVPSMQESFGSVYTEAWQFEKPVIGGNIPAISDVIKEGGRWLLSRSGGQHDCFSNYRLVESSYPGRSHGKSRQNKSRESI